MSTFGDGDKIDWSKGRTLPHTLGHEIEGTLSAVGPDAQALLEGRAIGQRFVVFPWIGCGECATCKRDQEHICSKPRQLGIQVAGGYSEYVLVPHPKYLLDATGVPEGLAATYMCSGITAFSALKKVRTAYEGEAIAIVGLGGVGMMGLQFARAMFPNNKIVGCDIDPKKLDAAMAAGAERRLQLEGSRRAQEAESSTPAAALPQPSTSSDRRPRSTSPTAPSAAAGRSSWSACSAASSQPRSRPSRVAPIRSSAPTPARSAKRAR
jgi:D-arabinose 1-dehydrogenase-like Zn-dependent alcohol dehydrogenase